MICNINEKDAIARRFKRAVGVLVEAGDYSGSLFDLLGINAEEYIRKSWIPSTYNVERLVDLGVSPIYLYTDEYSEADVQFLKNKGAGVCI